ncbi:MAG: anti-sigma factor antagonist [Nitrospirae bacterium]|nr:MAG: anti-sigma factor antagonist [Nitrospirota bacterium]
MPLSTRTVHNALILDLSGRFDAAAKHEVQQAIEQALASGTSHVILNLVGVSLIDSAALGLLVISHRKFKDRGATVSLVNPKPEVRLILDMAAMPKLIPSYNSVEEALAAHTKPPD